MDIISIIQQTWPGWRVVKSLGSGSYGNVYLIERSDIIGQIQSAVKVVVIPRSASELNSLRAQGLDSKSMTSYLEGQVRTLGEEIRVMETVKGYTNIVSIEDYHVIEQPEIPQWIMLIRMELLTPLLAYIANRNLSDTEVAKLGIDICSALVVCRKKNIVHRDIKPENIFISRDGDFKLGDFGVARTLERMNTQFTRIGTYDYMAPEVFNNTVDASDIDSAARVDIYSLGVVLYMLLNNGRIPFVPTGVIPTPDIKNEALMARMQNKALPEPRNGSKALKSIVMKACSFAPQKRYQSADEMRQALLNLGSANAGNVENKGKKEKREIKPVKAKEESASPDNRSKKIVLGIVAASVLLAVILLIAVFSTTKKPEEPSVVAPIETEAADTPSPEPADTPSPEPTDTPSPEPTDTPSPEPTDTPSPEPTSAIPEGTAGDDIAWVISEDGTLAITGTGDMDDFKRGSAEVPWADFRDSVTSVVVGEGVTGIGREAFYNCANMTGIALPEGVTSIRDQAFEGCTGLSEITIPASVTEIGYKAFYDCDSLTDVNYDGSEADWNSIDINTGNFYLTYANIHFAATDEVDSGIVVGKDSDPDSVRHIQEMLRAVGAMSEEATGEYDDATVEAVKRFQAWINSAKGDESTLPETDGYVDDRTNLALEYAVENNITMVQPAETATVKSAVTPLPVRSRAPTATPTASPTPTTPSCILARPTSYGAKGDVFGSIYQRNQIATVAFQNTTAGAPADAWDVSDKKDGSVLAWVTMNDSDYEYDYSSDVPGGDYYDLVIAADGGVRAPQRCSDMFADYKALRSVRFNNAFDTSEATDMSCMFAWDPNLREIDLSGIDTSNVTSMSNMFACNFSLEALDLSGFDTGNVTDMSLMFYGDHSLATIDTNSNFVASSAVDTTEILQGCPVLQIGSFVYATPAPTEAPTPTPAPTAAPTATPIAFSYSDVGYDLKTGNSGDKVKALQNRLIALGYLDDTADGAYGPKTKAAVKAFQENNAIHGDSGGYGVATAMTQAVLYSSNAIPAGQPARMPSSSWTASGEVYSVYNDELKDADGSKKLSFIFSNDNASSSIVAVVVREWWVDSNGKCVASKEGYTTWQTDWYNLNIEPNTRHTFIDSFDDYSIPDKATQLHWVVTEIAYANGEVYMDYNASQTPDYALPYFSTDPSY